VSRLLALALVALGLFSPGRVRATETDAELFGTAVAALERSAFDEAIDRFELLADRGIAHPDASYDRGIAYVRRAKSRGARPGDLGRAAAAFSEALLARPTDADAELALSAVKSEITRRRGRLGMTAEEPRVSLGWAIVFLVAENTWAAIALLSSITSALGLALLLFARSRRRKVAGAVIASVAGSTLLLSSALAALARHDRIAYSTGVVIVSEARLLDESGRSVTGPGSVIPEGATLRVMGQKGALARVSWGSLEGFVSLGQLRILVARSTE